MSSLTRTTPVAWVLALTIILFVPVTGHAAKTSLGFGGGPEGGTFQYFSNGISARITKLSSSMEVSNLASAGSVENIRRVDSGQIDFGIAYSGDTYLAGNGLLTNDPRKYSNVTALAYLYGAPAHLIVLDKGDIKSVEELAGKRVAVGGAGSGAAASAQRYFSTLGLWDRLKVEFIGYSEAAAALSSGQIDAMWVFAGFPNNSVIQAAGSQKIKILSTWEAGQKSGVFEQFPFYTPATIPAGTYGGVDYDVDTFQDSALWIASKSIAQELVYESLTDIFSEEGLSHMVKVKSTAKTMSVDGGLKGIVIPLHIGAQKFWKDKGLGLTELQSGS